MESVFEESGVNQLIERINNLDENSQALWGKMNVSQMLVHCAYAFEDVSPKASIISQLLIKLFRRSTVIGSKPYRKNMATAKAFSTLNKNPDFDIEKERLIRGISRIHHLGVDHFDNRRHTIFGRLSADEWNTFFSKHLDHHLRQFGV